MENFNQPSDSDKTDVIIGCHSVGNWGHGIGPSIAWFNPLRLTFKLQPSNLLAIEFFAYTPAPEWNGKKVRIPLEDDAVVTPDGVEWLYPPIEKINLIR
jgi:Xaa-Pro aminopeptidase